MKKKIFVFIFIVIFTLAIVGCATDDNNAENVEELRDTLCYNDSADILVPREYEELVNTDAESVEVIPSNNGELRESREYLTAIQWHLYRDIKNLLDNMFFVWQIFWIDALCGSDSYFIYFINEVDSRTYARVVDKRFVRWDDFTEFLRSVFTERQVDFFIDAERYIEVDGYTYVSGGTMGNPEVWGAYLIRGPITFEDDRASVVLIIPVTIMGVEDYPAYLIERTVYFKHIANDNDRVQWRIDEWRGDD